MCVWRFILVSFFYLRLIHGFDSSEESYEDVYSAEDSDEIQALRYNVFEHVPVPMERLVEEPVIAQVRQNEPIPSIRLADPTIIEIGLEQRVDQRESEVDQRESEVDQRESELRGQKETTHFTPNSPVIQFRNQPSGLDGGVLTYNALTRLSNQDAAFSVNSNTETRGGIGNLLNQIAHGITGGNNCHGRTCTDAHQNRYCCDETHGNVGSNQGQNPGGYPGSYPGASPGLYPGGYPESHPVSYPGSYPGNQGHGVQGGVVGVHGHSHLQCQYGGICSYSNGQQYCCNSGGSGHNHIHYRTCPTYCQDPHHHHHLPEQHCHRDSDCHNYMKCCYDNCLSDQICKKPATG